MGEQGNNRLSKDLVIKINDYYNQGYTCQETAEKFGVGKSTVRSYVTIRKVIAMSDEERKRKDVEKVHKRRKKLKRMAIEYKGGCCENPSCKYKRCIDGLAFHHLDPDEKDFGISEKGLTRSWKRLKNELDKCIMVCLVCHAEIHAKILDPNGFVYLD